MNKRIIISLGGSLIAPDTIDTDFLARFATFIRSKVQEGHTFVLITGGGKVCRRYQEALATLANPTGDDLDIMGIAVTQMNATLVRLVFKEKAHPVIVTDPLGARDIDAPIIVAAGWKPGASTDFDAVAIAEVTGAEKIINLSNTEYVYTADPRVDEKAEKIEKISWQEFRKLLPKKWSSGSNTPFDPIASEKAEALGLEVAVISGNDFTAISNCIDNLPFTGSIIS